MWRAAHRARAVRLRARPRASATGRGTAAAAAGAAGEARCPRAMAAFFECHRAALEGEIADLVAFESPTLEVARVGSLGERLAELWGGPRLGARVSRSGQVPPAIRAQIGSDEPRICCIFHHDTVWPVGSFKASGRREGRWYGPGIFDLKANIPLVTLSLQYLLEREPRLASRFVLISSPDEEEQGPASREGVPSLAAGCDVALVFEPPKADGAFKDRRKGVGRVQVRWTGRATHSGNQYHEGVSALAAASRLLLAAESRTRAEDGFTVNVGIMSGGSAVNTRPGAAGMTVDVRVTRTEQWEEFLAWLREYRDPGGADMELDVRPLTPPMSADHAAWAALEAVCGGLGLPYGRGLAGGASDGCHLAARGVKVLDGLGVAGAGEHAEHEHILLDSLQPTFVRNTMLMYDLAAATDGDLA